MSHDILDVNNLTSLKENITLELQPIWEMLRYNKRKLNLNEWLRFVEQVKAGVARHPTEYLDIEANSVSMFNQLIDKIFTEFISNAQDEEDQRIKAYKRKFDRALRHIKVLLLRKKGEMKTEDWETFVNDTKLMILNNPDEFFCFDLPMHEVTIAAIVQVFEGFAQDQKIRAIQSNQFYLKNL